MPDGAAECLAVLMKEARSKSEYQRIQCVWLRAALHWSAAEIALVVGWRAESVRRVQARYLRQGEAALRDKPRCGRHHENLTGEEERAVLVPFVEWAQRGEIALAAPARQALEAKLGRPVHPSVVYRALHRHGWRKVMPRPKHPKADAEAREQFKKSSRSWSRK
jgi:transposase